MILNVIAAAAAPLVINVLSSCGEDRCGGSRCPAFSDCAGGRAVSADDVASGFDGLATRLEKSGMTVVVMVGRVVTVRDAVPVI